MAERALYQNFSEPEFPFEKMRNHLDWLPSYCDAIIYKTDGTVDKHVFNVMINTILVCARARTSTMLDCTSTCRQSEGQVCVNAIFTLVRRFNNLLQRIDAREHEAEIYLPYKTNHIVTCKRSPRFNWKFGSQVDIGRSLDFFAAGHIVWPPFPSRGYIVIFERETLLNVYAEVVLLDLVSDEVWHKLVDFNNRKEILYNETMASLGLPYRFKWLFGNMERKPLERVSKVIASDIPPDEKWWEDNCLFVAGLAHDNTFNGRAFCTFTSRYKEYWPLIQRTYTFCTKYRNEEIYSMQLDDPTAATLWDKISAIFDDIKTAMSPGTADREMDAAATISNFIARLEQLESEGDHLLASNPDSLEELKRKLACRPRVNTWSWWLERNFQRIWWSKELLKMRSIQRYKLTPRLVYEGVPAPPSGYKSLSKL